MPGPYPVLLLREASASAWRSVVGFGLQGLVAKACLLAVWVGLAIDRDLPIMDNEPVWQKLRDAFLDARAAALTLAAFLLLHALFVAPYRLWGFQRDRADAADRDRERQVAEAAAERDAGIAEAERRLADAINPDRDFREYFDEFAERHRNMAALQRLGTTGIAEGMGRALRHREEEEEARRRGRLRRLERGDEA